MKIIFFGTPDYVLWILEKLYITYGKGTEGLVGVVTQSPKETGRKKFVERSPVDNWAYRHKIPVFYDFEKIPQASLGVVAAYGKMIPDFVIKRFDSGILNIHPSLLPLFRGASPIQSVIASGEAVTGVSIIKMDELMDHGPIVSQFKEDIKANDTTESLRKHLFKRSAQFLIDLIPNYLNGKIKPHNQDHKRATFTKIVKRENGFVDLTTQNPKEIERIVRAYHPWPGAWINVWPTAKDNKPKRLKILKVHIKDEKLIVDIVQLEGKSPVNWKQFEEGYPDFSFER